MRSALFLGLVLSTIACQSAPRAQVSAGDPGIREELFSALKRMQGTWRNSDGQGPASSTTFAVTSGGSVVRETMFPGSEHEMVNMYSLDGDALVMTHYCAGGNQPTMRATALDDGSLAFRFESVRDLKAADEVYMGEMTLTFLDDGTVEQHWNALRRGEVDHSVTFTLTRAR